MEKLWNKNYILLVFGSILMAMPVSTMNTAIPLIAAGQGMNGATIGLLTAVYTVGIVLTRPFFGAFIDRRGRRGMLLFGMALFLLALVPLRWLWMPAALLALRLIQGVGYSAYTNCTGTLVTDVTPPRRLVEGVGFFTVLCNIAFLSLGPALAVLLSSGGSYGPVFLVGGLLGVGAIAVFLPMDNHRHFQPRPGTGKLTAGDVIEGSVLKLCLANTCIALTTGLLNTFLPVWAMSQGIGNLWVYFAVYVGGMLLSRPVVQPLLRRLGTMGVIVSSIGLLVVGLALVGLSHTLPMLLLAGFLNGFGFGINNPVVNSLTYRLCPEDRRGVATATLYGTFDGGTGIGALIGGAVSQLTGYGGMFLVFTVALVAAATLFLTLVRPQMARQGVADKE